ncbi:protease HtpX [archaeon CG10_big_fil_rev_8_21_14_0_10_43_11]|nr:MAG: protease HtpX [archaeon CG10_big_fil_rev_8_21_14_0_10_43_11]
MMFASLFKTTLYLGVLTGILLAFGAFFAGTTGLIIAFMFASVINVISYFYSDRIVIALYHGREVTQEQEPELHALVSRLVVKARLPMPRVYLLPTPVLNAFATGRSPKHAAIAVTQRLLDTLPKQHVEAVLAHELTHVKNRDTLISTVAAILAGMISMIGNMAWYSGFLFGTRDRDNALGDMLASLALIIITPILALIIRFALSRTREYAADKGGARLTSPQAMIGALEALEFGPRLRTHGSSATAHLFIVNPFSRGAFSELFSTHPSLAKRVETIRQEFKI